MDREAGLGDVEGTCGLYLVVEAGASARERLAAALAAAAADCVLIEPAGEALVAADALPLVEAAQGRQIAVVVAGDARLARTLKADGVHLPWSKHLAEDYEAAREVIGGRAIVGVHAGKSRHDAMSLAEAGADYIGFGLPDEVKDRDAGRARRLELVTWWAEIFTVPCVAFDVDQPEEAAGLAAAGADFLGLRLRAGTSPAETALHIRAIDEAIRQAGRAA
jgi:thiamine-phosphate pyrophosphorylase